MTYKDLMLALLNGEDVPEAKLTPSEEELVLYAFYMGRVWAGATVLEDAKRFFDRKNKDDNHSVVYALGITRALDDEEYDPNSDEVLPDDTDDLS